MKKTIKPIIRTASSRQIRNSHTVVMILRGYDDGEVEAHENHIRVVVYKYSDNKPHEIICDKWHWTNLTDDEIYADWGCKMPEA